MTHATLRSEFENLIDPYAPVGQLGTGFTFTEGPIWHPVDHYLLFSDMPADVRRRWDAARGVVEVKRPSNKCNGMTYDAELNLIVCEHATSSLIRERPDGRREVIASHFDNQELNSPNDVCVHSSGAIYFSDPWYGRMPVYGVERPRQLGFQGVYRVPPGGGAPLSVGRSLSVRAAERPLLLAGRKAALRQRHRAGADPRLRRRLRRLACQRPRVRQRHPLRTRARRARRHEMRSTRQYLGDGAGRRMGLRGEWRSPGQGSRARTGRQSHLGRRRLPHAVHDRDALGLHRHDQGRAAQRALHDRRGRRSRRGVFRARAAYSGPRACSSIRSAAR